MERYRAYPTYKDSGLGWLGKIPSHWRAAQVKHFYDVSLGKMLQPDQRSAQDVLKPYLRAANITWSGVQLDSVKEMWFNPAERTLLRLRRGDLLISEGGDVGRACFWNDGLEECYFQNSINRARARGEANPRYLYYWLSTLKDKGFIDVICNKSTIAHYTTEKVQATPLILPEANEQERIAAFLEHETSNIDALIAKQRRLIELLQEKRQAVISTAVTKGLNPGAPMKDSGVAWLGEMPGHWTVQRAKHLFDFVTSGSRGWAQYYADEGELFVRIGNLRRGSIDPDLHDLQYVQLPKDTEGQRARVRFGDILISITADLGSVAVATKELEASYVSQHIALARPNTTLTNPKWLGFALLADGSREQFASSAYGGTKIQLSLEDVKEIVLASPPLEEQEEISTFLDLRLKKLDDLAKRAEFVINLLQERRTTLISAAVTGKIDVRDWKPPAQEELEYERVTV